jgi:ABC-type phosphate transport system substrate-binding protein
VVKKVIATNPNAIGYIATSALDDTVKEILRIDGEAK